MLFFPEVPELRQSSSGRFDWIIHCKAETEELSLSPPSQINKGGGGHPAPDSSFPWLLTQVPIWLINPSFPWPGTLRGTSYIKSGGKGCPPIPFFISPCWRQPLIPFHPFPDGILELPPYRIYSFVWSHVGRGQELSKQVHFLAKRVKLHAC